MERVNQLIENYKRCSRNDRLGKFDDEEWLRLESSLNEYWDSASDEERHILEGEIPMESVYMVCAGIKWEKSKEESI